MKEGNVVSFNDLCVAASQILLKVIAPYCANNTNQRQIFGCLFSQTLNRHDESMKLVETDFQKLLSIKACNKSVKLAIS